MPPETRAQTTLEQLREQVSECRACPLWRDATQAVFGEGPPQAKMMLVGEQPGDHEDRDGSPFVGPAGTLLERALEQAKIQRSEVYLTNAVKHFKYRGRGKRRIHQRPDSEEIRACQKWLQAELELIEPRVLVCLGVTAAKALLGGTPRIERDRGRPLPSDLAPTVMLTTHPSAVLRQSDHDTRHAAMRALVEDLARARREL